MSFDLDALLGLPFTFTFCGEEYTLPPDVEFATIDELQAGHPDAAFRRLIGEDQYARMKAAPGTFGARALTAVLEQYMIHLGLREGESEASPDSSQNTPAPSRPIYSVTTAHPSPGSVTAHTG